MRQLGITYAVSQETYEALDTAAYAARVANMSWRAIDVLDEVIRVIEGHDEVDTEKLYDEIDELKAKLDLAQLKIDALETERDEALDRIDDLTELLEQEK